MKEHIPGLKKRGLSMNLKPMVTPCQSWRIPVPVFQDPWHHLYIWMAFSSEKDSEATSDQQFLSSPKPFCPALECWETGPAEGFCSSLCCSPSGACDRVPSTVLRCWSGSSGVVPRTCLWAPPGDCEAGMGAKPSIYFYACRSNEMFQQSELSLNAMKCL